MFCLLVFWILISCFSVFVPVWEKKRWDIKLATCAGYSTNALYCDRFQNRSVWLAHLQISSPGHPLTEAELTWERIIGKLAWHNTGHRFVQWSAILFSWGLAKLEECVQESQILRGNPFILCKLQACRLLFGCFKQRLLENSLHPLCGCANDPTCMRGPFNVAGHHG